VNTQATAYWFCWLNTATAANANASQPYQHLAFEFRAMYLCNWAESHKSERAAMMQRRSLSWMMWEVSTAVISRRRNGSWIASAVLRATEAAFLVDVFMVSFGVADV
jgi:hypothetical protein